MNETPKRNIWNYISIIGNVLSSTWNYTKKALIYTSRAVTKYGGGALMIGAIGVSAVSLGKSLDTDTQVKSVQEMLKSQNAKLQQTVDKATTAQNMLDIAIPNISNSINELNILVENSKKDSVEAIATLQEQTDTNSRIADELDTKIEQSNQLLQNINSKTIKAEADLQEVNTKIQNANVNLGNLTTKAEKIIGDLENATSDLIAKNLEQDTVANNRNVVTDFNFKEFYKNLTSTDTKLIGVESKVAKNESEYIALLALHNVLRGDFDSLLPKVSSSETLVQANTSDITNIKSDISNLKNEDIQINNQLNQAAIDDTVRDGRLDTLDGLVAAKLSTSKVLYNTTVIATDSSGIAQLNFPPGLTAFPRIVANFSPGPGNGAITVNCRYNGENALFMKWMCFDQAGVLMVNKNIILYYVAVVP